MSRLFSLLFPQKGKETKIISNEKIDENKVRTARQIITDLQKDLPNYTNQGCGPFVAAIFDSKGEMLVKTANSVVNECCSNNHAEVNAIKEAEKKLGTYNLAPYNLRIYVTAEPCIMCTGAIMLSGIRELYYGVSSKTVEKITGFDEGFKPDWFEEFKKRGITVYGNIEPELGANELNKYVKEGKIIYKSTR